MNFKKGETIIYPQHGACIVLGTKKMEAFGEKREYLILQTVINEMLLIMGRSYDESAGGCFSRIADVAYPPSMKT